MFFEILTKLYNEADCVKNHAEDILQLGTKPIIITGRNSSRINGSLQDVTDIFDSRKLKYIVFDDIEENPSVETVELAAKLAIKENANYCIAIGGGSPIDAAKSIALLINNPNMTSEYLYENIQMSAVPIVAIPTTAGTGSEVTPYSILTRNDIKTKQGIKHRVFPNIALLDAKYLATTNIHVRNNTAVDALAHLIESELNTNSTVYSKTFSQYGMKLFSEYKEALLKDTMTIEENNAFLNISTYAGMSISHTSTSLPHALSYSLTYDMKVPHGKAVGLFLPAYLRIFKEKNQNAVDNVLNLLGFDNIEEFEEYLFKLIDRVEFDKKFIDYNAKNVFNNKAKLANYPYAVNMDDIVNMMK